MPSRSISAFPRCNWTERTAAFPSRPTVRSTCAWKRPGPTAADFLNEADEAEIARILREYGEEPRARSIARAIVANRPIERTGELAAIVRRAVGYPQGQKSDPATRTFQAIRIHLNAELDELEGGLAAAERSLKPGGRLAVVTFHSLEDRIVKRFFRERSGATPAGSRHRPVVVQGPAPTFEKVAKPVGPSEAEIARNPRSRSARLRSAVRTAAPAWQQIRRREEMSARSFRSVFMVASCAGAALGCYLVSLNVASERASLEDVENRIVLAQRDIRSLQTEIGTRGRLAQLERWNVKVLALSAPSADQFLEGGFQLARLARPQEKLNVEAPVVLASAPAPQPSSPSLVEGEPAAESGAGATSTAAQLMRQASLKLPDRARRPNRRKRSPRKVAEPAEYGTKQEAVKAADTKPAPVKAQRPPKRSRPRPPRKLGIRRSRHHPSR